MDFIIKRQTSSNRTVRMPDELIREMKEIADSRGVSFNQLVVQCCEFALEHLNSGERAIQYG